MNVFKRCPASHPSWSDVTDSISTLARVSPISCMTGAESTGLDKTLFTEDGGESRRILACQMKLVSASAKK